MSPKKIEKGNKPSKDDEQNSGGSSGDENTLADVPAGSNQDPRMFRYSLNVKDVMVSEEYILKLTSRLANLSLDDLTHEAEAIQEQLVEVMIAKRYIKERKTELEKPIKEAQRAQNKKTRDANNKQAKKIERETVRTIRVRLSDGKEFTLYLRGKDRLGTLRQRLCDACGCKKSQKFNFRVLGSGELIVANPSKTLLEIGVRDGMTIEAEQVVKNVHPFVAQQPEPPLIPVGGYQQAEIDEQEDDDDEEDDDESEVEVDEA